MTHSQMEAATAIWSSEELTVWHANLAALSSHRFEALLSPDELTRAATYGTPELRQRFIIRRGLLRTLLGSAMGRTPESIRFEYDESLPLVGSQASFGGLPFRAFSAFRGLIRPQTGPPNDCRRDLPDTPKGLRSKAQGSPSLGEATLGMPAREDSITGHPPDTPKGLRSKAQGSPSLGEATLGRCTREDPTLKGLRITPSIIRVESGKPRTIGGPAFNVSSSGDHAVFAIQRSTSRSLKLGVDVERMDSAFAFESLLVDQFSPDERLALAALPLEQRPKRFYQAWTRKEACAKALGNGLGIDLSQFEACMDRAEGLIVRAFGETLHVTDLPLPGGLVGAVASSL